PHLEVEVRPRRVARRADVADDLALSDALADRYGDSRLVAVRGREAAAVVDHDEIAVPALPACVDDDAGRRGGNRRPVGGAEVDTLVHPAPTPAERARDRRAHRPDEARARDPLDGRVRLGGPDLRGQVGARLPERVDLLRVSPLRGRQLVEADLLLLPRLLELPPARDELVAQRARLSHAHRDDLGLTSHVGTGRSRLRARSRHVALGGADLVDDLAVAAHDQAHVVET